ncbi:unnamed protein product [Pylaiella littoralis]
MEHLPARTTAMETPLSILLPKLNGAAKDALDARGRTPLLVAAEWDRPAVVEVLLSSGADFDVRFQEDERDSFRSSPLDVTAAGEGHLDVMRAIIERGGRIAVNAVDPVGCSALHHAARSTDAKAIDAIDMLIEAGASVAAASNFGATPLHYSASCSSVEATRTLLRHGVNVDEITDRYESPLHWAAEFAGTPGSAAKVDVLLRWGADETAEAYRRKKPVDLLGDEIEDEECFVQEEFERVKMLLVRAPEDRAWRRRGFLVLCRAHPDRAQLLRREENPTNDTGAVAPNTRSRAKRAAEGSARVGLQRTRSGGGVVTKIGEQGRRAGGEWAVVAGRVLGLDDGLFRTIVGYL